MSNHLGKSLKSLREENERLKRNFHAINNTKYHYGQRMVKHFETVKKQTKQIQEQTEQLQSIRAQVTRNLQIYDQRFKINNRDYESFDMDTYKGTIQILNEFLKFEEPETKIKKLRIKITEILQIIDQRYEIDGRDYNSYDMDTYTGAIQLLNEFVDHPAVLDPKLVANNDEAFKEFFSRNNDNDETPNNPNPRKRTKIGWTNRLDTTSLFRALPTI